MRQYKASLGKLGTTLALLAAMVVLTSSTGEATAAASEQVFVIANNGFAVDTLSTSDVKRIFRKEKTRISGKAVVPINAKKNSGLRNAFVARALKMSASDELSYWQDQKVQTGKQPPAELGNTMRAVFAVKGGVSYCFASQYKPGVAKVLLKL